MIDRTSDSRARAVKLLAEIRDLRDETAVYERLSSSEPHFRTVDLKNFRGEFCALRLAFACSLWSDLCEENMLGETAVRKAFLRAVTQSFESPQMLGPAETFSMYLHAADDAGTGSESPTVLALSGRFFQRLGLSGPLQRDCKAAKINPAFSDLVMYLEGFKSQFAGRFNEVVTADI
jgi:hypothetical protein